MLTAQARMFKFQIGEQVLEVIRADGSEDKESKVRTLERIQTFMAAEKNKGTPWKDLVAPFLVEGSPASQALLGSPDFSTWREMFLEINEILNTDCSNHFGMLVSQMSVPSSPFELNGFIYNEMKAIEKLVYKKLGGKLTAQGNYDGEISEEAKRVVAVTLEVVARDQFTSIVYPAKDYTGSTKFRDATRTQLATFYNNLAVTNNANLSLSCSNGSFDKRWEKKKVSTGDDKVKSERDRSEKKQKSEDESLKRKRDESEKSTTTTNGGSKPTCQYCKKVGHSTNECFKKKREAQYKKKS